MQGLSEKIQSKYMKPSVVAVKSGDTVRVHQKIVEGGKERIQIFEGLVIRVSRRGSGSQSFTVRRVASGVGVEKTYLIHSPNVLKIEITKRSKVRRNYLTYMRQRTGKSARLLGVDFDRQAVNAVHDTAAEAEEAKIHDEKLESYDPDTAKAEKAEEKAAMAAEAEVEAEASPETRKSEADKIEEQPKEKAGAKGPDVPQNKDK
jgi:large subunit ribosomal protein L19